MPRGYEVRKDWWSQAGSNRRPPACKAGALPAELWPQSGHQFIGARRVCLRFYRVGSDTIKRFCNLVGLGGFEPPTSPLSGVRSNQLSYRPDYQKSDSEAAYYTQADCFYNRIRWIVLCWIR